MERDDLRQVMERLEAIAALSTLFKNLWYEKAREAVENEKVRAYLTVYEDALPYLGHVLQYAHHSAVLLAEGRLDQDKYERLQMAFAELSAGLLGRDVEAGVEMPGLEDLESSVEISPEQEAAMESDLFEPEEVRTARQDGQDDAHLEGVSQEEVEALLDEPGNGEAAGIDALFASSEAPTAAAAPSQEEIEALLGDSADDQASDLDELLADEQEEGAPDADAELAADQGESEAEVSATDQEDLLDTLGEEEGQEVEAEPEAAEGENEIELDLDDLELGGEGDQGEVELEGETGSEEEAELADPDLGEEKSEEAELDLSDLLGEEDQGEKELSDDDLSALLNGEEEAPAPAPKAAPAPAPKAPAKPAPKPAAPAPKAAPAPAAKAPARQPAPKAAPKAPAKPSQKAAPAKGGKADEDSISQDEIDALFG